MKRWIVLYFQGGRFASFEHTEENMASLKRQLNMGLIQRDITGTEHYNVFGVRTLRRRR